MKVKRRVFRRVEEEREETFPPQPELSLGEDNILRQHVWNVTLELDCDDVGALIAQLERFHVRMCIGRERGAT